MHPNRTNHLFQPVVKITNYLQILNARKPFPLPETITSATNREIPQSVLIGKVPIGTESVPVLGPKFQLHPPKPNTVELLRQDGLLVLQYLDWVKLQMLMFVLVIVNLTLVIGMSISK